MLKIVLAIVASGAIAGCATPYQPKGFTGGYEEVEVKPGVYFLAFQGNAYTGLGTVQTYWHQRAKELCEQKGQAFEVLDAAATHDIVGTVGYTPGLDGGLQSMRVMRKATHTGYIRCVPSSAP